MTALEIAVQDAEGVSVAARAGADRIELCSALALGGLTPSRALIEYAVAGRLPVHVLIRPRGGGFEYSDVERDVMLADVTHALAAGAAGVVVGGTRDGRIDQDFLTQVRDRSGSSTVTFHRAFDTITDRRAAIETLVTHGVDRVLTSGGATRAPDALDELERIVGWAAGRIQTMAGGGVDEATIEAVLSTGVMAIHASAKGLVPDKVTVGLGALSPADTPARDITSYTVVKALRLAIDARMTR